jgi:hypothetical protein
MFLGGLEIIAIIGVAVWLTRRSRSKKAEASSAPESDVVHAWLRRWQSANLISDEEAAAIISFEEAALRDSASTSTSDAERKMPLVAEALGYLGGAFAAVGVILLVARYWPDLATGWRIGIPAAVAVAGVVGGALLDEQTNDALRRLRWTLWLVGTAAIGTAGGVAMYDALAPIPLYGWNDGHRVVFGAASLVAVLSGLLWAGRPRPLQQTTFLGGVMFAVGSATNEWWDISVVGAVTWFLGVSMLLIAQRQIGTYPVITAVIGAGAMMAGSLMMIDQMATAGALLLVVTSMVLIRLGQQPLSTTNSDLAPAFLMAGVLSLVVTVPASLVQFGGDDGLIAGLLTWLIGIGSYWLGERRDMRAPEVLLAIGGAAIIAGPAIVAIESTNVGTLLGLASAVVCLAVGATPGRVALSFTGAGSLLIYVPWSIAHFFPGEGRAPLIIAASGVLIVGIALFIARSAKRLGSES